MKPTGPDSLSERLNPLPRPALRSLLSGVEILAELPPAHALLCWEAYRAAHLWASTPSARRADLRDADAERRWVAEVMSAHLAEMETPLLALGGLFGNPAGVDANGVALAMRALGDHAEAMGCLRSAALLAEAGAHVAPEELTAVYQAAAGAKRAGWEPEAEAWYRYGLSLARQQGSGEGKARFLASLGNHYRRRGNLRLAERLHVGALRAARRVGATLNEASAQHDLCYVLGARGKLAAAEEAAQEAARLYGVDHPRLPVLLQDLAYLWMSQGRFAAAYPVMVAVLPHLPGPREQLRGVGNLARAAAGAGERFRFEQAWARVVEALRAHEEDGTWADVLADALTEVAHGALAIGEPRRALWAVGRAEPIAMRAGRGRERMELDAIRGAAEAAGRAAAVPPPLRVEHPLEESMRTARSCVALLARRSVSA